MWRQYPESLPAKTNWTTWFIAVLSLIELSHNIYARYFPPPSQQCMQPLHVTLSENVPTTCNLYFSFVKPNTQHATHMWWRFDWNLWLLSGLIWWFMGPSNFSDRKKTQHREFYQIVYPKSQFLLLSVVNHNFWSLNKNLLQIRFTQQLVWQPEKTI